MELMNGTASTIPPFPDGVPICHIERVSLQKLVHNDEDESIKLLGACIRQGFFYLDLNTEEGENLVAESNKLLEICPSVFGLDLDEKMAFKIDTSWKTLAGYKAAGAVPRGPFRKPLVDTTEFWNIDKDHLHGVRPSRPYPDAIMQHQAVMQSFTKNAHDICMLIMSILAVKLGLAKTQFTDLHRFDHPSPGHIRMTHKPPSELTDSTTGLGEHTDIGSVTLLFNSLGGLQTQSMDAATLGKWEYVKPLPGHAIVNLGDAVDKYSNGLLRGAKHRVIDAPGLQKNHHRYSVGYFTRPEDDSPMKMYHDGGATVDPTAKTYTAAEWARMRAGHFLSSSQGHKAAEAT